MAVILGSVLWIQLTSSSATKANRGHAALPEGAERKTA
jgi:hypothetical protein